MNTKEAARPKNVPPPRPPSPKLDQASRHSSGSGARSKQQQPQQEPALPANFIPPTQMTREQLQAKLQELLDKKSRVDRLLQVYRS